MSPGCDTASLMVAVPSESTGKLSNSQLANLISQTASQAKSQMPSWRPRDGRNDAYLEWHSALTTFEHDLGIDIDAAIPVTSELIEMIPYILTKGPVTDHDHEVLNAFLAARQEWIEQNEALFNVILSSLDLDGPSLERDLRTLAFLTGSTKDGRAIRKWALGFADVSTVSTQADLQAKLDVKLPKSATLGELETHSSVPISKVIGNLDNEAHDKAMVLALREHHKNNKDAATLKGICVDFEPCNAKVKALLNENERWLHTGGATSGTTIDMIGEHGMVSLPPKSPHVARWQRLLKDFRGSKHEPYTPYTGQMVTMLDNPMPNG